MAFAGLRPPYCQQSSISIDFKQEDSKQVKLDSFDRDGMRMLATDPCAAR
jgi:hypothetical protein